MFQAITGLATRLRIVITRLLTRLGFSEDSFLAILAVLIGVVTAAAALGFHELIAATRVLVYGHFGPAVNLYGGGIAWLVILPAAGGLAVGLIGRYVSRTREGHGIIDVMESAVRSRGILKKRMALEKIVTSAITIGSGGSAGAEGPIVQIGAGIASAIGQFFRLARRHTPVLLGCGTAAGISAIFNAPIGGLLFTLEVILRDFSLRAITPIIIASVVANVTMQTFFRRLLGEEYGAIFTLPADLTEPLTFRFLHLGDFLLLGLICGLLGVTFTRMMHYSEGKFAALKLPTVLKPALGGALLGLGGVAYIMVFGWWMLGRPKPILFDQYAMPAFFGDGYRVVEPMLGPEFYTQMGVGTLLILLTVLCLVKIVATCLTLASGGSGGVIAPSLFLGATAGGILGVVLQQTEHYQGLDPFVYALVGMAAVLAAVVHAPLAAILILFEITRDYQIMLPAMLAAVVATSLARVIFADSIYTLALRKRGIQPGMAGGLSVLQRLTVEQVDLEPAATARAGDPLQRIFDLSEEAGFTDFVVIDNQGKYAGMVVEEDIKTALIQREAIPLLDVGELMRAEIPLMRHTDDLATVMDTFSRHDVGRLPVTIEHGSGKVIGLISRSALMKRYQQALAES